MEPAEVVEGQELLGNPISWVVSLRPYPPAFPRLRGGELALVAMEHVAQLEPPTTLADVVRQLASRDASGVAVRGEIDEGGARAAREVGLPLLRLELDAPLHDIEQAIMRACALHEARREMMPVEKPDAWLGELLAGRLGTVAEAQERAKGHGVRLEGRYAVGYVGGWGSGIGGRGSGISSQLSGIGEELLGVEEGVLVREWEGGLALLLPPGAWARVEAVIIGGGLACGIGREKGLLEVPASLAEARLAAMASGLMYGGKPVRYAEMGADRLLMVLYRDEPEELRAFVEEMIGALLRYDEGVATPVLPTLRSFIEHGGKLRETAAELFVHRNTLAYRLERAGEILGVDLKDPGARLAIELALRALPLIG